MTYVEIWKDRIAKGEATIEEAYAWLTRNFMDDFVAWDLLNG